MRSRSAGCTSTSRSTSRRRARAAAGVLDLRGGGDRARSASPTSTATSVSSASAVCSRPVKHPNADRLQLCQVDVGESDPRQIVCGAWNFGAGATVGVALPGAVLPNGLQLERRKVRGELSDGMILAEHEVELGDDHTGIIVLPERDRAGHAARRCSAAHGTVLELETSHNRPTCSPSTASRARWRRSSTSSWHLRRERIPSATRTRAVDITIDDFEGCPRYIGRLFRDATIGPSPVVAQGAAARGWNASHLERRRRDELRHARTRQPAARLRLRQARGREDRRAARATRERRCARSTASIASSSRTTSMIADGERVGRARRDHGRRGDRDRRGHDGRSCSRPRTSSRTRPCARPSACDCAPKARTAGRRASTRSSPSRRRSSRHSSRRACGRRAGPGTPTSTPSLPQPPVVRLRPERTDAVRRHRDPAASSTRSCGDWGSRVDGENVAVPTWRARDVTREIDVVEEVARFRLDDVPGRAADAPSDVRPAHRSPADPPADRGRARRIRLRGGVHVEPAARGAGDRRRPAARSRCRASRRFCARRSPKVCSRRRARNVDAGNDDIALFELAHVYLPSGEQLPEERWRVGGDRAGRVRRSPRARSRASTQRSARRAELRARRTTCRSRAAARGRRKAGSLSCASPTCPATGARSSSTSTRSSSASRTRRLRGRDHVSGGAAGSRLRRRRDT